MTTIPAPAGAADRTGTVPAAPGTLTRIGLAAVVVAGPLSTTILRGILPYHTSDTAATIAAKVASNQGAQTAQLWLTLIAMTTLVPAVTAVGLLAARRARRLATCGMALAVVGFSLLSATTAMDFAALAGVQSGIGTANTAKMLDSLNNNPTQLAASVVFVAGHIVGMILLGVALLHGRTVPAWTAWALIASQPLHLVFAVIVPSNLLDAGAWTLTTIGFTAVALTFARRSPSLTHSQ